MNATSTITTPPVYQVGDTFRISTRALHTYGTITKINRVNLLYDAEYQPSPTRPAIIQHLTLARHEMAHADIARPGVGIIQIAPRQ